jgi:hypothetical protein
MIYTATAVLRSDDLRGTIWYRTGSEAIQSVLQITSELRMTEFQVILHTSQLAKNASQLSKNREVEFILMVHDNSTGARKIPERASEKH